MRYDWDPAKDAANVDKHGIAFIREVEVFDDPRRLDDDSTRAEFGEARRLTVGRVRGDMIAVIYTDRDGKRRIISARKARRSERRRYDHGDQGA